MLFTVFPCFINVGRTRLLTLLFKEVQAKHVAVFNLLFMFFGCLLTFLSPFFGLQMLMGFVGALPCFFFIYFIPIVLHFACLYKKRKLDWSILQASESPIEDTSATPKLDTSLLTDE
jgi:hypothetical protein